MSTSRSPRSSTLMPTSKPSTPGIVRLARHRLRAPPPNLKRLYAPRSVAAPPAAAARCSHRPHPDREVSTAQAVAHTLIQNSPTYVSARKYLPTSDCNLGVSSHPGRTVLMLTPLQPAESTTAPKASPSTARAGSVTGSARHTRTYSTAAPAFFRGKNSSSCSWYA
eukprot:SAG11_NODE_267_length_11457_cov_14.773728_6_plen_166_part_00